MAKAIYIGNKLFSSGSVGTKTIKEIWVGNIKVYPLDAYVFAVNSLTATSWTNNPSGSKIYVSTNKGQGSSTAQLSYTITGTNCYGIYVISDGETNWDYVTLTVSEGSTTIYTESCKANEYGTLIGCDNLDQSKTYNVVVTYGKDGSVNGRTDRGYVLLHGKYADSSTDYSSGTNESSTLINAYRTLNTPVIGTFTANKTSVANTASTVTLTCSASTALGEAATVTYSITEGSGYASISGNTLSITANSGGERPVKVQATATTKYYPNGTEASLTATSQVITITQAAAVITRGEIRYVDLRPSSYKIAYTFANHSGNVITVNDNKNGSTTDRTTGGDTKITIYYLWNGTFYFLTSFDDVATTYDASEQLNEGNNVYVYVHALGNTPTPSTTDTYNTTGIKAETVQTTYKVAFNLNNGSGSVPQTLVLSSETAMGRIGSTVPTRSGYTFRGWSSTTTYNSKRVAYSSTTGGSADNNGVSAYVVPSAGWNISTYCTNTGTTLSALTGTTEKVLTLYAQWEANTVTPTEYSYKIVFNANGGSGSVPADISLASETATSDIGYQVPTRSGYTFRGWSSTSTYSATRIAYTTGAYGGDADNNGVAAKTTGAWNISTYCINTGTTVSALSTNGSVKTLTLYAQWESDSGGGGTTPTQYSYRIVFNGNGASFSASAIEFANSSATHDIMSSVPSRSGYTFAGWSAGANKTSPLISYTAISSSLGTSIGTRSTWTISDYLTNLGVTESVMTTSGTVKTLTLYAQWVSTSSSATKSCSVDLYGEWEATGSTITYNGTAYKVYRSKPINDSEMGRMKVTWQNNSEFEVYIYSDSEAGGSFAGDNDYYDYVFAMKMNVSMPQSRPAYNSSDILITTKKIGNGLGAPENNTSKWKLADYSGSSSGFACFIFSRDISGDAGNGSGECGYVMIPTSANITN